MFELKVDYTADLTYIKYTRSHLLDMFDALHDRREFVHFGVHSWVLPSFTFCFEDVQCATAFDDALLELGIFNTLKGVCPRDKYAVDGS